MRKHGLPILACALLPFLVTVALCACAGEALAAGNGYPESAKEKCEEGAVTLQLRIGTMGEVTEVKLGQSSGYDDLDQAAMEAAKHFRFTPGKNAPPDGRWFTIMIKYSLKKELTPEAYALCQAKKQSGS